MTDRLGLEFLDVEVAVQDFRNPSVAIQDDPAWVDPRNGMVVMTVGGV